MGNGIINLLLGLYCCFRFYTFASLSPLPEQGFLFGFGIPSMAYLAFWGIFAAWCLYGARGLLKGGINK